MVVTYLDTKKSLVKDFGCSYRMCPRKKHFETLEMKEDEIVLLRNIKICKVLSIGTERLKIFDDSEFLLQNIRYIISLKRNLLSISMFYGQG